MCLFCRIIKGEIPCARVYENNDILAFLDLAPAQPGHTLVVPKEHHENLLDTPISLLPKLFPVVASVGAALMQVVGATGFNVMQNNFAAAGQTIFHVHWHVIPRSAGDGLPSWHQGSYANPGAMQDMAARMAAQLKV